MATTTLERDGSGRSRTTSGRPAYGDARARVIGLRAAGTEHRPRDVAAGESPVARVRRGPFLLLVLSLLGGGLICLLVINTTLGAASFQIDKLQRAVNARSQQVQALQQQIASDTAPQKIAQEAHDLGMRPQSELEFLNPRTHRIYGQRPGPMTAAGSGR